MVPDFLIGLADLLRALVEDDAIKDRIPVEARPLDHALVAQKLRQITAHRPIVRAVRCAEIDEQDAHLAKSYAGMVCGEWG
ncbi:hypothetical protein D3C86_1896410 [compost metagenome]